MLLQDGNMDVYVALQSFALLLLVIWYTAEQQCPPVYMCLRGWSAWISLPLSFGNWIDGYGVNLWIRFTFKALLTPCCIYGSDRP